jgi:basic membrane protein A
MRKRILKIAFSLCLTLSLLAGCGAGQTGASNSPSATENTGSTESRFKVGFVLLGSINDGGWTQAHYEGEQYVENNMDGVECVYVENVPESSDCERVMTELAQNGCKVIFACSSGYMDYVIDVAENFPDVIFMHCDGYKTAENVGAYFGRIEQVRYITGVLAGLMTESNQIGFVAAHPISEVIRGINAFTLGVRSVNPDATVRVVWTNTWFDTAEEKEAANSLINMGCDVMAQHQDSPGVQQASEEKGVYCIGYDSDMSGYAETTNMTSIVWNWGPYYASVIESVMNGTWKSELYFGDMSTDMYDITELRSNVPDDIKTTVNDIRDQLMNNTFSVFTGPIYDQDGNVKVADGVSMTDDELLKFDWFVEGVDGTIPS